MRAIAIGLQQRLAAELAHTAICWRITKADGVVLRGTECDEDVTLKTEPIAGLQLAGTYQAGSGIIGSDTKAGSDFTVNNMEVSGAFQETLYVTDLTVEELEAGQLNNAAVVVFEVDWAAPDDGAYVLRAGTVGDVKRTSDGMYTCEVRGPTQQLAQQIMDTYSDRCTVVRFGDSRCTFNVAAQTIEVTAISIGDRKNFLVSGITTQPVGFFAFGILRGLSGKNTGLERNVKLDDVDGVPGQLRLFYPMPYEVAPGDTFELEPGCDRLVSTCSGVHNNIANFRGYGVFIPGVLRMMAGPLKSVG